MSPAIGGEAARLAWTDFVLISAVHLIKLASAFPSAGSACARPPHSGMDPRVKPEDDEEENSPQLSSVGD